jgi:hypothetical protein
VQAGARGGAQALHVDRMAHHARRDVHDPAEAALGHAVEHPSQHRRRRAQVALDRLGPVLVAEALELAGRGTARVVHQDVGCGAGGQQRGAVLGTGDVARHRGHRDLVLGAELLGGLLERAGGAGVQHQRHTLGRQRLGAGAAQSLAGRADDGRSALQPEIHAFAPLQHRSESLACFK